MFADIIAHHARSRSDVLACVDLEEGVEWTWAQMETSIGQLSAWFFNKFGPASGERIAILSRNSVSLLIIQHACARAGLIFVPLNWRLAGPELDVLLQDAEPKLLFCESEFDPSHPSIETIDVDASLNLPAESECPESARMSPDSPMTILYTSGTTGRPKGVIVTSQNAMMGADNFISGNAITPAHTLLCDMPMFHTAGLFAAAGVIIQAGGTLLVSSGFQADQTLACLSNPDLPVTHYFSVPQMAQVLWNHPDFDADKLQNLELYSTGGAPNPAAQIKRFVEAGIPMADGFGMSETSSTMGMPVDRPDLLIAKAGSCGLPYKHIAARIVDGAGNDVPDGQSGELLIKGPSVTPGYWNQAELSAKAFTGEWFKTGDIAKCDSEGFFYLVDRKKDMFISGGENVYPAEVEAAIAELADVAECAVIGTPDERWGEVGCAFVIPVDGRDLTESEIIVHCRSHLAGFKVPKSVIITDHIPRTGSGKAQKHLLSARVERGE